MFLINYASGLVLGHTEASTNPLPLILSLPPFKQSPLITILRKTFPQPFQDIRKQEHPLVPPNHIRPLTIASNHQRQALLPLLPGSSNCFHLASNHSKSIQTNGLPVQIHNNLVNAHPICLNLIPLVCSPCLFTQSPPTPSYSSSRTHLYELALNPRISGFFL